jgi:hypothetical protein
MTAHGRRASLLGPPGSQLRRWRLVLLLGLLVLGAWLVGPYAAFRLPEDPSLVPKPGQSRIHTILVATWWAAALNAALCALLLATSGFWARPERVPLGAAPRRPSRPGAGVLVLLLAATALAGALRWPLAHKSVWWDEAWTVRHTVVGTVEPAEDDPSRLVFEPVSWLDTLFYYRKPTNHVLYSLAARSSVAVWRAATGAPPQAWDAFALRFPAYAAALLSVFGLGLLVFRLGFPRAAPAAAFLLAIHPWHIRFGADGRGYAFMVLLAIVAAGLLLRGLRRGGWATWLGYGAAVLAMLWVHALAVYFPLALGLAGVVGLALGPGTPADRAVRVARFAVANLLAGMAYLQLMGPNLAQSLVLKFEWKQPADVVGQLAHQIWLFLSTGLPRRQPFVPELAYPSVRTLWGGGLLPRLAIYGVLPFLVAVGLVRALRRPAAERAVWLGVALAVPLALLHRWLQPFLLIERFTIYGLVAVVPLLAVGLEGVLQLAAPARLRRVLVPAGLALGLAAFALLVGPQTRLLLRYPQTASREVAELLARAGEGVPGGVLRAGLGLGGNVPDVYDPYVRHVHRGADIAALAERSRAEGRPLYVFYGYNDANRTKSPDAMVYLDDPRLFEEVAAFPAIEAEFLMRVFRYTGQPLPE